KGNGRVHSASQHTKFSDIDEIQVEPGQIDVGDIAEATVADDQPPDSGGPSECSPGHGGDGSRLTCERSLSTCMNPWMFVRMIARQEPPEESRHDSDKARQIEHGL